MPVPERTSRSRTRRSVLLVISAVVCLWAVVTLARLPVFQTNDFLQYWSAGRLLLAGQNPYSLAGLRNAAWPATQSGSGPLIPYSPPWALTFMVPIALLPVHLSRTLWLLVTTAMVGVSIQLNWRFYGGDHLGLRLRWVIGFLFAPTLIVLLLGQMGPLVLLALTGFLVLEAKRRDFLAGLLVMPAAVKPHLAYLFWIALLVWACRQRRWSVLAGFFVASLICTSIAVSLDPSIFSQYWSVWSDQRIAQHIYPVLSGVLPLVLHQQKLSLELIAPIIGVFWFCGYWYGHREMWDWRECTPLLLLVSFITSPYGWFFDAVVLLPAILQSAIWMLAHRTLASAASAAVFVLSNVVVLIFVALGLKAFWYVSVVPLWLVLYVVTRRATQRRSHPASASR